MNFSCPFIRPLIYVIIIIYNAFDFPMTGSQPPSALVAQRQSVARPLIRRAPRPTWGFWCGSQTWQWKLIFLLSIYSYIIPQIGIINDFTGIVLPDRLIDDLVGGLHLIFMIFHILGIIIPTDELIFFRGVGIPPTRWDIVHWQSL